jgi:MFS family permease
LIDVRLFADRGFLPAALTAFGFGAALFGTLILLPLYYQVDRGESALVAGLLIAPQGIGAALFMPFAGRLSDRIGPGRVVPFGLLVVILGTLAYTIVGAHTSYTFLAFALFVRGIGFGFTMMPAMAAAYRTLDRSQIPRATTSINILQRVGGSVGTALLAVILERQIAAQVPGVGSSVVTGGASVPSALRQHIAAQVATAFGHTFWWAVGIAVLAFVPALFLSREPVESLTSATPPKMTPSPVPASVVPAADDLASDLRVGAPGAPNPPLEAHKAGPRPTHRHRQPRPSPSRRGTPKDEN